MNSCRTLFSNGEMEIGASVRPSDLPLDQFWSPALLPLEEYRIKMFFMPLLSRRQDSEWRPVEQMVSARGLCLHQCYPEELSTVVAKFGICHIWELSTSDVASTIK